MSALRRILAVEDEADIRMVLQVALGDLAGFELELCASGADGVAAAPRFAPDLLLLDVMMPELDGPATLEALRALPTTAETPVVFLTAKVQPREIERLHQLGALGVIRKPFDPMTLADEVRALWAAREGR